MGAFHAERQSLVTADDRLQGSGGVSARRSEQLLAATSWPPSLLRTATLQVQAYAPDEVEGVQLPSQAAE